MTTYKQGDIVLIPFPFSDNPINSKPRPVLIISNSGLNLLANECICLPLTSNVSRNEPNAVFINTSDVEGINKLEKKSAIRTHLVQTLSKKTFIKKIASLSKDKLEKVLLNVSILIELED